MVAKGSRGDVKDVSRVEEGIKHIRWAGREMPVTEQIRERFSKERPLEGGADLRVPAHHL